MQKTERVTDEMVNAADSILSRVRPGIPDETIRFAIAAALSSAEEKAVEELRRLDDALGNFINAYADPYEPIEDYEAETARNLKELSDAYNAAYSAGVFKNRSALVYAPAVESEPVGYLKPDFEQATEPKYIPASERVQDWAKAVFTIPVYAHPPRSSLIQSEEGWRPIETAPKDGTWFLGSYREKCVIYRWSQRQFDKHGNGWDFTANGLHSPTHWRPLPTPPSLSRKTAAPGDGSAISTKDADHG